MREPSWPGSCREQVWPYLSRGIQPVNRPAARIRQHHFTYVASDHVTSFSTSTGSSAMRPAKSRSRFTRLAKAISRMTGRPGTFILAVGVILVWLISGPLFRFSDTWQLVINTGTTVITFLMVFLIQATQNRDAEAVQVKLDELLRATAGAHNALLDLEQLEEHELDRVLEGYCRLAEHAREDLRRGARDTGVPEVA
jgi:low affinity Fe/Cu permease